MMKYFTFFMIFATAFSQQFTHNLTFVYDSETIPQPLGVDCSSKQMKTCGSTGPYVCWEQNHTCPGYKPSLRGSDAFSQ